MVRSGIEGRSVRVVSHLACWLIAIGIGIMSAMGPARAQPATIAVPLGLTGGGASIGTSELEGVRLGIEEANAAGGGPLIQMSAFDDKSDVDMGKQLAHQIVASDALLVVGPATTLMALETGQIYSDAGVVNIGATTTGDEVTAPANFFRAVASTRDQGDMLASYLRYVLGGDRAVVIFKDDGYGRSAANGFRLAAERLGLTAEYHSFTTAAEAEQFALNAAADPANPAVFIAAYDKDSMPPLMVLRRHGARGPILGTVTMSGEPFSALFANEPEERQQPGFFTEGIYTAAVWIFDSGNSDTLAFADRYRKRFGHEPTTFSAEGYEGARLAVAAVRATAAGPAKDLPARRAAVHDWLLSLNSPENGIPGLNGPMWFTPERGREQALRVGRFQKGVYVSAPGQLVPVRNADPAEIASGAVIEVGPGRFLRRQQVVYTGIFLNEISRVDIPQSTFTADFYLWMSFARGSGIAASDPTDIRFPTLVRGSFDPKRPAAQGDLDDGTTYRLWQITGDFKNDYDLHHYPADRQTLTMRFFNARAASDRIVYVQDRRSSGTSSWQAPGTVTTASSGVEPGASTGAAFAAAVLSGTVPAGSDADSFDSPVAPEAFRNLTQWAPVRANEGRDNLVTQSALGDPRLVGLERVRELSGFSFGVELRRRVFATLAKTLLPLGLMALIMYASLHFPTALVKEKVTVAITGALSGAVLLSSINAQLGSIGYVIALEYGFYAFFALCLLCIVAVLLAERLRGAGRVSTALAIERSGRNLFAAGIVAMIAAGWVVYSWW